MLWPTTDTYNITTKLLQLHYRCTTGLQTTRHYIIVHVTTVTTVTTGFVGKSQSLLMSSSIYQFPSTTMPGPFQQTMDGWQCCQCRWRGPYNGLPLFGLQVFFFNTYSFNLTYDYLQIGYTYDSYDSRHRTIHRVTTINAPGGGSEWILGREQGRSPWCVFYIFTFFYYTNRDFITSYV
jgi:hypothetical protein